jgi:Na+-transporting NADH:ubiquinone oxidoreductase subunit C
MKKDSLVYTVIFTFLTAFFFVFFLSLANGATEELVRQNQRAALQSAVLNSVGLNFTDPAESYEKSFDSLPEAERVMKSRVDGKPVLIYYFSGSGLWGTVTGILAVEDDLSRIVGLDIISHNETPGLGGRIDESWFKEQFRGERIPDEGIRILKGSGTGDEDRENGIVDAVTGASLTSTSMQTIINDALAALKGDA